jgi:hypothetical protein
MRLFTDTHVCSYLSSYFVWIAASAICAVGMEASEECSRYAADECVCLLAVLEAVLGHLEALEQGVLQQLSADVIQMLNSQRQPQVTWHG